jgi:hypothetical protein
MERFTHVGPHIKNQIRPPRIKNAPLIDYRKIITDAAPVFLRPAPYKIPLFLPVHYSQFYSIFEYISARYLKVTFYLRNSILRLVTRTTAATHNTYLSRRIFNFYECGGFRIYLLGDRPGFVITGGYGCGEIFSGCANLVKLAI